MNGSADRQVTVEFSVDAGPMLVGPVVAGWFDGAVHGLARTLLARLQDREEEPAAVQRFSINAYGGPVGAMWADMEAPELGAVAYSTEHHRRFFEELPANDGSAYFSIGVARPLGDVLRSSPPSMLTTFIRHPWGGRLGCFRLETQLSLLGAEAGGGEAKLLAMINDVVERRPAVSGSVEVTLADGWKQRLWIGFLDEQVGERLGGAAGLSETGHFVAARRAPAGGYVVQTTWHLADLTAYDDLQPSDRWWRELLSHRDAAEEKYLIEPQDR